MNEHESIVWREAFIIALADALKSDPHGEDSQAVQRASDIADHAVYRFNGASADRHFQNGKRQLEAIRNG